MEVEPLDIPDVLLLRPRVFGDDRGFFLEAWNRRVFDDAVGHAVEFVQDNQSGSERGVLRGLHYQTDPHAQGKLVRVVEGLVFDVAVDIRRSSETYGRWVGAELSSDEKNQLWIPPGFAHGFYVLSGLAQVFYKTTDYYAPECDRAIRFDDPEIGIDWPIDRPPVLSEKDSAAPLLADAETFD